MTDFVFHETSLGAGRAIDVREVDGVTVGRVLRGEIAGCEKRGTFRFEPGAGTATSLGIRSATGARTVVRRLLRPQYVVVHDDECSTFTDRLGENVLYFAVTGTLGDRRIDARQDWDETVQVTADSAEIGRLRPGRLLGATRVQVAPNGPAADPGSALFGLLVLLPFLHRIYTEETELIEAFLE